LHEINAVLWEKHVEKVSYQKYGEYSDDSSEILKEIVDNQASENQ